MVIPLQDPMNVEGFNQHCNVGSIGTDNILSPPQSDEGFEPTEVLHDTEISMLTLLRHFATYTNQKQEHMTYLLKLLKFYTPAAEYDRLPSTGAQLLPISANDWPGGTRDGKLPKPTTLEGGGKYLHFGLIPVLNGESAGVLHKDANLLQFVDVYQKNPYLLPVPLREKV